MSWREPRSVTSARSPCHSEEVCFCRFDSENADVVEEVNERARVPFARITLGVLISPSIRQHATTRPGRSCRGRTGSSINSGGSVRMSKRYASPLAMVCALVVAGALAFAGGASGAASLPTLTVTVKGTKSVSISGSVVSGAVSVVGSGHGQFALVRLNPGASIQQAAGAVQSHHGDINALTPYGSLIVDAGAPGTVQAVLSPGNYVALNVTGNAPAFAPFTVTQSSSPAALPAA